MIIFYSLRPLIWTPYLDGFFLKTLQVEPPRLSAAIPGMRHPSPQRPSLGSDATTALCSANAKECQPTQAIRQEQPLSPLHAGEGGSLSELPWPQRTVFWKVRACAANGREKDCFVRMPSYGASKIWTPSEFRLGAEG